MAKKPSTTNPTGLPTDPAKMLEQVRKAAEDNLAAVKDNFEKAQNLLTSLQKDAEDSLESVQAQGAKISMAVIDTVRQSTEANLKHAEKLVGVTSIAELIELQSSFLRSQAEQTMETSKSMQAMYQEAGTEMLNDAKSAAEKTLSDLNKR
ncbi:MAG: phasin family protein [Pseudomonadota bacterium]